MTLAILFNTHTQNTNRSQTNWHHTLPETNIAPGNGPYQKDINLPAIDFQGRTVTVVSGRVNRPKGDLPKTIQWLHGVLWCHVLWNIVKFCNLQPYDLSSSRNLGGMVDCCKEISMYQNNIYIYTYRIITSSKSLFWSQYHWLEYHSLHYLFSLSTLQAPVSLFPHYQDTCTRRSSPAAKDLRKRSFKWDQVAVLCAYLQKRVFPWVYLMTHWYV